MSRNEIRQRRNTTPDTRSRLQPVPTHWQYKVWETWSVLPSPVSMIRLTGH